MHFGEYQLFPGLISLSLLSTAHPRSFQPSTVRAFSRHYPAFTLAMDRSPGFGSAPCDSFALFGLAFASASPNRLNLATKSNSLTHYAKGTRSDGIRKFTVLPPLVGKRFQVLFHSPPGVLFTFPSRYWCTIGRQVVFSLGRWSSQIPTGFHAPRGTRGLPGALSGFRLRASHPLWGSFPAPSAIRKTSRIGAPQPPKPVGSRFGLLRFRSPLLTESLLISFPPGTEMFQFPGLASLAG